MLPTHFFIDSKVQTRDVYPNLFYFLTFVLFPP